jgi:hypothetical protein
LEKTQSLFFPTETPRGYWRIGYKYIAPRGANILVSIEPSVIRRRLRGQ